MSSPDIHQARASIRPVKQSVEDDLLARDGVVAVDLGEKISNGQGTGEQVIVVFVEKKKPVAELGAAAIPAEIDGVKTDVQEMQVFLQRGTALARLDDATAEVDAGKYTNLLGGISISPARSVHLSPPDEPDGNYIFAGTLGAMVRDRNGGATMALTNWHVAAVNPTWAPGDRMVQPGRLDGGNATTDQFGSLTRAVLSEHVDGAVITLDAADQWSATVQDIGGVAGTATPTVGLAVQKRGRTTEHTFGSITSTDFTVSLSYYGLGSRTLRNQLRITPDTSRNPLFSDHGDSGSVVMDANRNVVGLLFAGSSDGSTFACPIQNVLDELSVDLIVQRPILTRPIICELVTRSVACTVVTRPALCTIVTRAVTCPIVTRSVVCNLVTRPQVCDVLVTRGGCVPVGPGPVENPVAQLPQDAVGEDFLAGYLTALEAIASEQERDGSQN